MRIVSAVLALLLAALAPRSAQAQFRTSDLAPGEDFHAELAFMWWQPTPALLIQTDALAAAGEAEVDFVREFGLEKDRFREFRAVLKPGRAHKLRFSYVPIQYAADAVLQRTITFGGQTFDVGVPASTAVKWDLWRVGYEWDFVARDRGLLGFIVEGRYNKVTADVASPAGSESAAVDAFVPTLGIIGRGYLHRAVSVTGEFTGFKLPGFIADRFTDEGRQFEASFRDFDIYATVSFSRFLGLQGGYRSIAADYAIDADRGDLKTTGTYFGAMIRF